MVSPLIQGEKFKGSMEENCNGRERNIYSLIFKKLAILNVFGGGLESEREFGVT